jgi:light-regulated signal transduction histidine kinase (bacteriophytochrome)
MTHAPPLAERAAFEEPLDPLGYPPDVLDVLACSAPGHVEQQALHKALLNILEDADEEKARSAQMRRATLNILEDFEREKQKVDSVNAELRREIVERTRVERDLAHAKAAAEAVSSELEAFSYSVAHDLRAPLRSIDGFSQALMEDCEAQLSDEGKRYLKHVCEAAQQMGELIDALLSLSRVTRAELRREQVDLSSLARKVLAKLQTADPERVVALAVEDGLTVHADARLVEVVLTNLLANAWKFTRSRTAARIELAQSDGVLVLRDNGAGFDAAYSDKLFGVFQRLHSDEEFEGTGIGLATVQRIVHRHGGAVWAEGAVNGGASFHFTFEEHSR